MLKVKSHIRLRMDFQNLISCIECHKEENNVDVILETLKTIVNICCSEKFGKDAFRDAGGLDFLLDFLLNTDQVIIIEYSLNVLAFVVDGNISNQTYLTEPKIFQLLQTIFSKQSYPVKVMKNAIVLFSTILFQNRIAQDLTGEGESLLLLINLYKSYVPISSNCVTSEDLDNLEIWLNINRTLCFAVNNPLNEKNQVLCSSLFPLALRIIENSSDPVIIEASSSFLSLTIANNIKNQDLFSDCDGYLILKRSLNKTYDHMQKCMKECNNIISKVTSQIINSLISVIINGVLDHEKNAALCGKLGIAQLMIKFLSTEVLSISIVKKIILALAHCIDACGENRLIILDVSYFDVLLKKYLESDDDELLSAAKYLLQVCLSEFESPINGVRKSLNFNGMANGTKHSSNDEHRNMLQNGYEHVDQHSYLSNELATLEEKIKLLDASNCTNGIDNNISSASEKMSDSDSDISLQSAGHFNRLQQMKIYKKSVQDGSLRLKEFNFENEQKDFRETKINSKNPCSDKKGMRIISNELNRNIDRKTGKTAHSKFEKTALSKGEKTTLSKNAKPNKSKEWNDLHSLKEKITEHKLMVPQQKEISEKQHQTKFFCSESDKSVRKEKKSPKNSSNLISNQSNVTSESEKKIKSQISSVNSKDTVAMQSAKSGKICDELFSYKLRSSQKPYDRSRSNASATTQMSSKFDLQHSKPGHLEVIVLPGTFCCEHKLVAQVELLEVCALKKDGWNSN